MELFLPGQVVSAENQGTFSDYHYNQFELGGIDCMYGGQFQDTLHACGLWDGLAPALEPSLFAYGSRLSKN